MAKIQPNEKCPCGYDVKFKKCCKPYLEGKSAEDANRLARTRYVAQIKGDADFLWQTLHPDSPRKKHDSQKKFMSEQYLLKNLNYQKLILLDERIDKDSTVLVSYVKISEGNKCLSYLEESTWQLFNDKWYFVDGLRKSSERLGCLPESIRVGDLKRLGLHDSQHN